MPLDFPNSPQVDDLYTVGNFTWKWNGSRWVKYPSLTAQGPQGSQGPQGAQGNTGPQGVTGPQGSQGDTGSQGPQGAQGSQGATGSQGDVGPQGATGAQGSQGSTGATGSQGATGPQGDVGAQGAQGATGPQGAQGDTGPQGSQGSQGAVGSQGPQGAQGAAGQSSSFYDYKIKTGTTSGDPGSTYITYNSGTQTSASQLNISHIDRNSIDLDIFLALISDNDFIIIQDSADSNDFQKFEVNGSVTLQTNYVEVPVTYISSGGDGVTGFANDTNIIVAISSTGPQGPQGSQGAAGSQGAQGPQGATGSQGPQGDTGPQGTTGPQGAQGDVGPQGAIGSTGAQGAQGPQGITGAQGAQGSTGPQGDIGVQGPQGSQGATGAQGSQGPQGAQGDTGPAAASLTGGTITGSIVDQLEENWNIVASAATGTINFDVKTASIWYYTSNATANHTVNVRGDGSTTLSSLLAVGDSITVVWANTNGTTAYYPNVFQVDGSTITPKWQGGTAPTSGNTSAIDVYSYVIIKTATTPTYTVLASQTQFK